MVEPQRHSGNETPSHAKRFPCPPPPGAQSEGRDRPEVTMRGRLHRAWAALLLGLLAILALPGHGQSTPFQVAITGPSELWRDQINSTTIGVRRGGGVAILLNGVPGLLV